MFRTIVVRNENLLRGTITRTARATLPRCISYECTKRVHSQRFAKESQKTIQPAVWSVNYVRGYCSNLPAHTRVTLPALSPTMELGTIVSWEKKEGDKLNEGDLLAEIETDKATMGFETPEEGYLAKILITAGSKDVPIGKLVCIIVENEADVAAFKDFKDTGSAAPAKAPAAAAPPPPAPVTMAAAPPPPPPPQPVAQAQIAVEQKGGPRIFVSPMAKKLAEAQRLRLDGRGTGLYGSIKSHDLAGMQASAAAPSGGAAAAAATPAPGAFIDIPVSNVRAVIAKRLLESKVTIPHYYLTMDINMTNVMKIRSKLNKSLEKQKMKVSVNDFIIKAAATACQKVPEANSAWMDTVIRQYESVDVCVAVSTERGLITPIVPRAHNMGVVDISNKVKELAGKARENKLKPAEFQGGTFTVSNLGMFGISQFCAVINPPQSCILAIGTSSPRLIACKDSENGFKEAEFMSVTLSCDHRTVDGAVGARWLQFFKKYMEDPVEMIM